jgi:hypothetical protein
MKGGVATEMASQALRTDPMLRVLQRVRPAREDDAERWVALANRRNRTGLQLLAAN